MALVGYGPRPNECCAIVRERADVSSSAITISRLERRHRLFNYDAAAAAAGRRRCSTTRRVPISKGWRRVRATEQAQLFHASPRDPVWDYVLGDEAALASFLLTTAPLVLVGHSHVALALAFNGGLVRRARAGRDGARLDRSRALLNPGSVGQPRDGDPRAAWLLLDFERMFGSFRRVAYPIERTQRDAG